MNQNELYHHGVKGMKWGVRRYRNYDGSYTKAGLKRFDKSMEDYEVNRAVYKGFKAGLKKAKQQKQYVDEMKSLTKDAKKDLKTSKKQLEKDYKHLKYDKLADQGKALYAAGKTINGNEKAAKTLAKIGGLSASLAEYNRMTGKLGNAAVTNILSGVGIATVSVASIKAIVDQSQNKKLRAYYAHTSNY